MPAFPDLTQPLVAGPVALRLAAERDIPEVLIAHQDDPGLADALGLHRPPSGAELGRRAEAADAERAAGSELWLTVLLAAGNDVPADDECRGQIEVSDVDWGNRRAALTVWIASADRRRGLGTGALALAGDLLLRDVGLERVEVSAETDNAALRGAALAAGYREEGVLRRRRLTGRGRSDLTFCALGRADGASGT